MPETVSTTSPIQYLHQAGFLELLPLLYGTIVIPEAVARELAEGRAAGVALPDPSRLAWMSIERAAEKEVLRIAADLGPGERAVLALGLRKPGCLLILDDALARSHARHLNLGVTGTLGVLLKAKALGRLPAVRPVLDKLETLRFRLDPATRAAVLKLAGEAS